MNWLVTSPLVAVLLTCAPVSTSAQTALDRIVGPTPTGAPMILPEITGQHLGRLGEAAGVPMGFEGIQPSLGVVSITATGKSLRAVLDEIVHTDPRYEWRDIDGVIVMRSARAWTDLGSPLNAVVSLAPLDNITAGDALDALARMVGVVPLQKTVDTQQFSVRLREGATLFEVLNAIVQAHGRLTWVVQRSGPSNKLFPFTLSLNRGSWGFGFGIPAGAMVSPVVSGNASRRDDSVPFLDRRIGTDAHGQPIHVAGIGGQTFLTIADAANAPIGVESLPVGIGVVLSPELNVTGLTLREALDRLVGFEPRYQWRDVDGIPVVRPVASWFNRDHPLFRQTPAVRLQKMTTAKAIAHVMEQLGAKGPYDFTDGRVFTLETRAGTVLDLLVEIARAHGALSWVWEEISAAERARRSIPGRYTLLFAVVRGAGQHGFTVP